MALSACRLSESLLAVLDDGSNESAALAAALQLPLLPAGQSADYFLQRDNGQLQLQPADSRRGGALRVDFSDPRRLYRLKQSGIRQELPRAVGCKPGYRPDVLDATAGLAVDAFVLAGLGCQVSLLEQHPVVYALLADGLRVAKQQADEALRPVLDRMTLMPRQNALDYLCQETRHETVYLDPMFAARTSSAKVKKAMQYLHDIAGYQPAQEAELLHCARQRATKRVVVKRALLAECLAGQAADFQVKGKTIRYDVYLV